MVTRTREGERRRCRWDRINGSLRRRFTVVNRASGAVAEAPDVVVVGRQTRRNLDLVAVDGLSTLTVHFEPTGFYRLFHVPMRHLTDLTPDATDVLGPEIQIVHERVVECRDVTAMIGHIESFLGARLDARRPLHPYRKQALARGRLGRHARGRHPARTVGAGARFG